MQLQGIYKSWLNGSSNGIKMVDNLKDILKVSKTKKVNTETGFENSQLLKQLKAFPKGRGPNE